MSSGFCARRPGFSLLELAVASVIVGSVAAAALAVAGGRARLAERTLSTAEASILAELQISGLQLLSAEELRPLMGSPHEQRMLPPFDRYTKTLLVRALDRDGRLLEASVVIHWTEGRYSLVRRFNAPSEVTW